MLNAFTVWWLVCHTILYWLLFYGGEKERRHTKDTEVTGDKLWPFLPKISFSRLVCQRKKKRQHVKGWMTALGEHEAIKQEGTDVIALVLQGWGEITRIKWLEKVAAYFWKFQILGLFTCSYEIELNCPLFPTVNIKHRKDFCLDWLFCTVEVEVWSIGKICGMMQKIVLSA